MFFEVGFGYVLIFLVMIGFKFCVIKEMQVVGVVGVKIFEGGFKWVGVVIGWVFGCDLKFVLNFLVVGFGVDVMCKLNVEVVFVLVVLLKVCIKQQDEVGWVCVVEVCLQEVIVKFGVNFLQVIVVEECFVVVCCMYVVVMVVVLVVLFCFVVVQIVVCIVIVEFVVFVVWLMLLMCGMLQNFCVGWVDVCVVQFVFIGVVGLIGGLLCVVLDVLGLICFGMIVKNVVFVFFCVFVFLVMQVGGCFVGVWLVLWVWLGIVGLIVCGVFSLLIGYFVVQVMFMVFLFVKFGFWVVMWMSLVIMQVCSVFLKIVVIGGFVVCQFIVVFGFGLVCFGFVVVFVFLSVVGVVGCVVFVVGQVFGCGIQFVVIGIVIVVVVGIVVVFMKGFSCFVVIDIVCVKLIGFGNDVDVVKNIMGDVFVFVCGMSFGFGEVVIVVVFVVVVNIKFGQQLQFYFKNIVNNVFVVGILMEEMGFIFNKVVMQVNGVQNDVISQFVDCGIFIYQVFVDQMGVIVGEVFKMVFEGKVDFEIFLKVVEVVVGMVVVEMGKIVLGVVKNFFVVMGCIGVNVFEGVYGKIGLLIVVVMFVFGFIEECVKVFGDVLLCVVGLVMDWVMNLFIRIGEGVFFVDFGLGNFIGVFVLLGVVFVVFGVGGFVGVFLCLLLFGLMFGGFIGLLVVFGGFFGIVVVGFVGFVFLGGDFVGFVFGIIGIVDQIVVVFFGFVDQVVVVVFWIVEGIVGVILQLFIVVKLIVGLLIIGIVQVVLLFVEGVFVFVIGLIDVVVLNLLMIVNVVIILVIIFIEGIIIVVLMLIQVVLLFIGGLLMVIVGVFLQIIQGGIELLMVFIQGIIMVLLMLL